MEHICFQLVSRLCGDIPVLNEAGDGPISALLFLRENWDIGGTPMIVSLGDTLGVDHALRGTRAGPLGTGPVYLPQLVYGTRLPCIPHSLECKAARPKRREICR